MVDVETKKKPMSWKEYQAGLASGKMNADSGASVKELTNWP
jgi:hypothetical protein